VWQDRETILDMVQACHRIQLFVTGISLDEFLDDEKTQPAVRYQPLVLGEAVKRTSDPLRQLYSGIPWSPMALMRDKVIHGYELVGLEEVWRTANHDVPELLPLFQQILSDNR
jgi:uncharacterized protein with HEPN domain